VKVELLILVFEEPIILFKVKLPDIVKVVMVDIMIWVLVVLAVVGSTPEPSTTELQDNVPFPAILHAVFEVARLFKVIAPVTVKITAVIVNESAVAFVGEKVKDVSAFTGAIVSTG